MSGRTKNAIDLTTTKPFTIIRVDAMFFDSRRKEFVLSIHATELKDGCASITFDFAVESTLSIETVTRFNAKRLAFHAANWKNVPGVMELITKILKVRGLSLTEEAKAITGITEPTVKVEIDEPES